MAELERNVIRERVVAGLEYTRQRGTRSGRAVGRPRAVFRRDQVTELRRQGFLWREIARRTGVGVETVRRVVQGAASLPEACQKPTAEAL